MNRTHDSRGRRWSVPWIQIGVIAAVVAAVFAWLTYCRPPEIGGAGSSGVPEIETTATGRTVTPTSDGSVAAVTYLADLEPDRGQARLAELPPTLEGEAGYEHAVVIACPSNQTGDQISEVTYETRNRYHTFRATLRPYRDPPDDVLVELQVFSDPVDRDPGAPAGGDPELVQLRMGQAEPVSATVDRAYYLRLRVVCEKPGGFLILAGASVE